jgi:shikimate kinase
VGALKRKHVILVGLPGAGKTTVGGLVAEALGAPFADFDRLIEERAGKNIPSIFREDGEVAFRRLEATIGAEQLAGEPAVLAPGGGYFLDDTQRRLSLALGYAIYLQASPAIAAARLAGSVERPLLRGFDPVLRLHQLLELREPMYLEAPGRVTTDGASVAQVADAVSKLARTFGGW